MRRVWEQNKYLFLVFLLVGSLIVAWSETTSIKEAYAKSSSATNIEGYNFSDVTQAAALYINWASSDVVTSIAGNIRLSFMDNYATKLDYGALLGYFSSDSVDQLPLFSSGLSGQNSALTTSYSYYTLLKFDPTSGTGTTTASRSNLTLSTTHIFVPYVCYGRMLNLLGFDSTTKSSGDSSLRVIIGYSYMIAYMMSMSLNNFFGYIMMLLKLASPFRLVVNGLSAHSTLSGAASGVSTGYTTTVGSSVDTTDVYSNITALPALNGIGDAESHMETGITNILDNLSNIFTEAKNFGFVIIVINLAIVIFCTMMIRKYRTGEGFMAKFKTFAMRIVFWSIGMPLLFVTYDSILDKTSELLKATGEGSTRILASTFLDFESWVNVKALDLPTTAGSVRLKIDESGNMVLDADTEAHLRNICYNINVMTEAFGDLTAVAPGTAPDAVEEWVNYDREIMVAQGSTAVPETKSMSFAVETLRRYISGRTVKPSDYEASIKSAYVNGSSVSFDFGGSVASYSDAGLAAFIRDFSDPKNYDYGMYVLISASDVTHDQTYSFLKSDDMKEMFARIYGQGQDVTNFNKAGNRGAVTGDEAKVSSANCSRILTLPIFSPVTTPADPTYGYTVSNMFGGKFYTGRTTGTTNGKLITFLGGGQKTTTTAGMSPLAMFNYLSTDFGDQSLVVYATATGAQTDAAKMEHYSVNLVGTGIMQIIYALNGLVLMSALSIIGYGYGISLLLHNFRGLVKIVPSAITGLMGSIKGIASVIALFCTMIAEVVVTFALYSIASLIMLSTVDLIEAPIGALLKGIAMAVGSSSLGEDALKVLPLLGILSIVLIFYLTTQMLKWRHAIVMAVSDVATSAVNKFMATQVSTPDLGKGSSVGQKVANAASIGGSLALAGARMSGTNPLSAMAEKFGVNTAPNADAGTAGEKPDGTAGNGQDPINDGSTLDENGRAITDKDGNPISMTQADVDNFQDTTGINMNDVMDTAVSEYGGTDETSIQNALQDIGGSEAVEAYNQTFGDNNTDFNNAVHSRAEGAREASGQRSIVNANMKMTSGDTNIATAANMAAFQNNKNAMIDQSVGGDHNGYVGGNEVRVFSGAQGAMTAEDMRTAINNVSVQAGGQAYAMGSVPADAVMAMMDANGDGNVTAAEKQVFQMQTGFTQESFDQLTGGNNATQAITFENHFVEGGGDAQFRMDPVNIQTSITNLNAGIQDGVTAGVDATRYSGGQSSDGQQ